MSARTTAVLDRFPRHLAATDPDKRFEFVVSGLVGPLETVTRQVGDLRRAHRLSEAPTTGDLLGLAALHGLRAPVWSVMLTRLAALGAAASADPVDSALLAQLLGLSEEALAAVGTGEGEDPLPVVAARPARHRRSLELLRGVVRTAVLAHSVGNATPTALLTAAAAYLGLEVESVAHTEERWWHVATCRDTLRLEPTPAHILRPMADLVGLEENPFRKADIEPTPKKHGQLFQVVRGGIDDVDVTVRVLGVGVRTARPMVVECFAGHGLCFEGTVADGSELRFEASGQVTLDGTDVTGSAWSFRGAVFASATQQRSGHDFVFAGDDSDGDRQATFVVTTPLADAFEPTAAFPHGASTVAPLGLPRGLSRWAAFVRVNHTSGPSGEPPRHKRARFDATVFAEDSTGSTTGGGAAGVTAGEPSMRLGFVWEEREPFAVRLLLPRRFSVVDDDKGTKVREPLRRLLDRHRAAGVDLRVEYADPRWTLGTGVVREQAAEAIGTVLSGTELWRDRTTTSPGSSAFATAPSGFAVGHDTTEPRATEP
jgi:hypothetical protein